MKYIIVRLARRKNAKRHVVEVTNTLDEALKALELWEYRNNLYDYYIYTSNWKKVI